MWIHRVSGAAIMVITIIFSSMAINKVNGINNRVHNIFGVIVLSLVILVVLGGVFSRSRLNRLRWKTNLILKVKNGHKVNMNITLPIIGIWISSSIIGTTNYIVWNNQIL